MAVAEAETTEINHPEWTKYRKKNGLDPLGMQNSSISLSTAGKQRIAFVSVRVPAQGNYCHLLSGVETSGSAS